MQKKSIPTRKLPPQFEQKLKEQISQHSRTAVIPKRSWIQRNPFLFQVTVVTTALLVFFSKPIYDSIFEDPLPPKNIVPAHKR